MIKLQKTPQTPSRRSPTGITGKSMTPHDLVVINMLHGLYLLVK